MLVLGYPYFLRSIFTDPTLDIEPIREPAEGGRAREPLAWGIKYMKFEGFHMFFWQILRFSYIHKIKPL